MLFFFKGGWGWGSGFATCGQLCSFTFVWALIHWETCLMGVVHQTDCFITRCIIYSCTRGWCSHLLPLPTAGFIPLGGFSLLPQPFIQDTEHKRTFFYLYYIYVCICIHTHTRHTPIYMALVHLTSMIRWYNDTSTHLKSNSTGRKEHKWSYWHRKYFPCLMGKLFFLKNETEMSLTSFLSLFFNSWR